MLRTWCSLFALALLQASLARPPLPSKLYLYAFTFVLTLHLLKFIISTRAFICQAVIPYTTSLSLARLRSIAEHLAAASETTVKVVSCSYYKRLPRKSNSRYM